MSSKKVFVRDLVDEYSVRAKNFGDHSSFEFFGVSNEDGITKSKNAAKDKVEDYKIIEQGCFAYNPYRINVGSIAYLDEDIKGFISPAYVVFKTKPKSIIPELLFKFLKSKEGLRQIKLYARGTVRQALRFEDLCKIELTIPHYDEQVKLFEKISLTENETIKLNNETDFQLNIVTQLRQAFLREAMQGKLVPQDKNDEPATELLKRIKAEKEKLIVEGKLKKQKPLPEIKPEEIPYQPPNDLIFVRLQDICHIEKGNIGIMKAAPGDYPLVTLSEERLSDKDYYFDCKAVIIPIISSAGHGKAEMKRMHYQEGKFSVGNILCAVHPFNYENFNARFLFEYMNNYKHDFFVKKMRGAANVSLRLDAIAETPIPIISIKTQNKFEELMQLLDELEKNINQSKEETNLLLQTVLREALEEK